MMKALIASQYRPSWALFILACIVTVVSSNKPFILRVRQPDGTIERVGFRSEEDAQDLTLREALEQQGRHILQYPCSVQFGSTCIPLSKSSSKSGDSADNNEASQQTLQALGIRHGSLLTILEGDGSKPSAGLQAKKPRQETKKDKWDPFPDLAKDYEGAMRMIKRRKNSAKLSFNDLSAMHQALHSVEPQSTAPLNRLYLCQVAAERFAQSTAAADNQNRPRVALLFGTLHRERKDLKKIRHKTSLSSTTESEEFCQVAKVQAVWEPKQPTSSKFQYDAKTEFLSYEQNEKVMKVAEWLGLVPVGWMYSYPEQRHGSGSKDEDALPVFGYDIQTGGQLQISHMKRAGRDEAHRGFCTVAMHTPSGATEVFQLSDVAVQMVAENIFVFPHEKSVSQGSKTDKKKKKKSSENNKKKKSSSADKNSKPQRFVTTKHPVLVDGQETKNLDSVLCLVNTALLSHTGTFVGKSSSGVKKSNPYQLTKKTRKTLAKALQDTDQSQLLEILCNFNLLVALYDEIPSADMQALVETVRKFARGLKKGTSLDPKIIKCLNQVVNVI